MKHTWDDYYEPLDGHIDTRQLAMFADNRDLAWKAAAEPKGLGWTAVATLDGQQFTGEGKDYQSAFDVAVERAIAAFS